MNASGAHDAERFERMRREMVQMQIRARGICDPGVLAALARVPRHEFVPHSMREMAYEDNAMSIGYGQTISQPYIVALMTELARPNLDDRVLEVGTGCGYQSAVLAELFDDVYSIEIIPALAEAAQRRLQQLGYANVHMRTGDGYAGWADAAPFQVVLVTAAPDHVPQPLLDQLDCGGRMIIPVGRNTQQLVLIEKSPEGWLRETKLVPVAFVPMTGQAELPSRDA